MRKPNREEEPTTFHSYLSGQIRQEEQFIAGRYLHYQNKIQQLRRDNKIMQDFSDTTELENSLTTLRQNTTRRLVVKNEKLLSFWKDMTKSCANLIQKHELKI